MINLLIFLKNQYSKFSFHGLTIENPLFQFYLIYFSFKIGTQGGTFARQRENPFSRAHRAQQRLDSNVSSGSEDVGYSRTVFPQMLPHRRESDTSDMSSSADSCRFSIPPGGSENSQAAECSDVATFLVSDNHSINGE